MRAGASKAVFRSCLDKNVERSCESTVEHFLNPVHIRMPTNRVSAWFTNFKFAAKKIDVFSRVLFPGVFAFFNFTYWAYFLTREQESMGK